MKKILLFICFLILAKNFSFCDEPGLSFSGYFQSGTGILHIISNEAISNTSYAGKSTLRLNFVNNDTGLAKLDGSVDFNILYGLYTGIYAMQSNGILIGKEALLTMDIRKLYLVLKAELFDFYIGRQLIKFGEGLVFSPLNPFSTIDFTDVNFTRLGVDGIRIRFQLSDLAYLEALTLPTSDFTNSDIAGRLGFNLSGWDISFASFYRGKYDYISGGFSFKGDLILGLYGEFVYHYKSETNNFWNTMIGMDYSFLDKFIVRMEYYYHSFETNDLSIYEIINSPIYPFVSKHYLLYQLVFTPTLIDSLYLSYIDNLMNESLLLMFSYQRNLYQNVNLIFNVRYLRKDLTGLEMIDFDNLYYSLEFNVRY
ncbi:MAG: hypothetical protein N2258_05335 [Brevinematales bacterium]|nr:hypothetical protein [Brevinematales bacterium]